MGDFNGTGIEIWAEFGPIGSTEKRVSGDYEQLLRVVFSCFHGQKINGRILFSYFYRLLWNLIFQCKYILRTSEQVSVGHYCEQ